jgi:hypothetical protein
MKMGSRLNHLIKILGHRHLRRLLGGMIFLQVEIRFGIAQFRDGDENVRHLKAGKCDASNFDHFQMKCKWP